MNTSPFGGSKGYCKHISTDRTLNAVGPEGLTHLSNWTLSFPISAHFSDKGADSDCLGEKLL